MLSWRQWRLKRRFARAVLRAPAPDYAARDEVMDLGSEAVEPLVSALSARSAEVRISAAWALGKLGHPDGHHRLQDPRVVRALVDALGDSNTQVRDRAAEALSYFQDPKAVDALIRVLDDRTSTIRATAAKALGALHDRRAVPSLIAALDDTDHFVRNEAVESLGCFKDPAGIQALVARLHIDHLADRYEFRKALSSVGEPAVEFIIPALRDPRPVCRRRAAAVLGMIADRRALEPLLGLLGDPGLEVAEEAMRSILLLGGRPPLGRLLDHLAALDRGNVTFARRLEEAIVDAAPESEIPRLSEPNVRRLAALKDVRFAWANCNFGGSHSCDFHLVRQRARQELVRRGLEV